MANILDWDYQPYTGEYHAAYKGLRLRAVYGAAASNPFTDSDCQWPIMVHDGQSRNTTYEFAVMRRGTCLGWMRIPLSNEQLVHDQRAVASIFGYDSIERLMVDCDADDPTVYCTDALVLRDCFEEVLCDLGVSAQMDAWEQMFRLAGVPAYRTTVCGYSQSDWAEVLVVATPEAMEKFGVNFEKYRAKAKAHPSIKQVMAEQQNLDAWIFDKACELMLAHTADLYGHWAFGDVYGYVVEKRADFLEPDDDPDDFEDAWEEIPDGSCWGYFGPDFDASGLEEAAMDAADSYLDHHAQEMTDA